MSHIKIDVTLHTYSPLCSNSEKKLALCVCVCVCTTARSRDAGSSLMALRVHIIAVFFTKGCEEYAPSQHLEKTGEAFINQRLFAPALLRTIVKGEFHLALLI